MSSEQSAHSVSQVLGNVTRPVVHGDVVALVLPRSESSDDLTARIVKTVEGERFRSVIVMASSGGKFAGRIHVGRREVYPTGSGDIPIDLRSVDELCDEDDDIFADDRGLFDDDGVGRLLPWLRAAVGDFALVPVVMGEESPDYCRELGSAVGEVMYNQPTLLVALVDVLEASEEELRRFGECLSACDIDHVMRALMSQRVRLDGAGPLMAALIAAVQRGARNVNVVELAAPELESAGRIGVVISRG